MSKFPVKPFILVTPHAALVFESIDAYNASEEAIDVFYADLFNSDAPVTAKLVRDIAFVSGAVAVLDLRDLSSEKTTDDAVSVEEFLASQRMKTS